MATIPYYLVYSAQISQQPDSAHEIHDVMCANGVANLGYPTVLAYPKLGNLWQCFNPFQPQQPDTSFIDFYNVDTLLKVSPLPITTGINISTLVCKFYLPFYLRHHINLVHTRDWNFAQAAVKSKIPTIYERHYYSDTKFNPTIVNSPFLKIAIAQSEPIRQSLITAGIPKEKALWLNNGFSPSFLVRQPEAAENWRKLLLKENRQHLVVYSGALYTFKGIDLLIDVAKQLPQIQFAITGGTEAQVNHYSQLAREKEVNNMDFLGWILPRAKLISLLQAADILAHPHCSGEAANFTNPVKFFQYMASGVPIVITEIPPLLPFKSSPIIALWCSPDNPVQYAQTILKTLEIYPRKVEGYGENINFARQFSWENRAETIINLAQNIKH